MICCAWIIVALRFGWMALRRGPSIAMAAAAPGHACHHAAPPTGDRGVLLEIGLATGLLLILCGAMWQMAFAQEPTGLFDAIHQIGCLALGRSGTS